MKFRFLNLAIRNPSKTFLKTITTPGRRRKCRCHIRHSRKGEDFGFAASHFLTSAGKGIGRLLASNKWERSSRQQIPAIGRFTNRAPRDQENLLT